MVTASELAIDENATALQMAQEIFGAGISILSASYTGDPLSSGIYTGGDTTSPGVVPGDTGVILSTGHVEDFTNSSGEANQDTNTTTNTSGVDNHVDFNLAAGARTYDAAFLDVTFIPTTSKMSIQFVFASEEYPEFQASIFQDFVGVWVNGTQVSLGTGDGDVDPGNLNDASNQNLFIDNTGDAYNTEMDGFTVTLTLDLDVTAGVPNSIRIGIADVSDRRLDSNLLIAGESIQGSVIAEDDALTVYPNGTKNIDVLANDIASCTLSVTHINGVAVSPGDTVTLTTGQTIQLMADGTLNVSGDGNPDSFVFTYTASDGTASDIALVNVDSIPCFVAGCRVKTPDGLRAVEELGPGDLVLTRDDGPQAVRWAGQRTVAAEGELAPVHIRAGALGNHRALFLSPQHRVLLQDAMAELLFGEREVLVAAKDLVNDQSVVRCPGGEVTYVHILFDRHQVVWSEGLLTESFLPGPQTTSVLEAPVVEEITRIFPELDPVTGSGYGAAARRTLRWHEARLLLSGRRAA